MKKKNYKKSKQNFFKGKIGPHTLWYSWKAYLMSGIS